MNKISQNDKPLNTLLHWMEINECGPYGAMPATLLSQMEGTAHADLLLHFQHNEKSEDAVKALMNLMEKSFPNFLRYGAEDGVIFNDQREPVCAFSVSTYSTYLNLYMNGIKSFVDEVSTIIEKTGRTKKQPIVRRIYKNNYGFDCIDLTLPKVQDVENVKALYPFVDMSPEEMWYDFKNSSANVLLFIGPPGVGKTNFIRKMMDARGYEDPIHLVDNEGLLLDPDLMGYVQSDADMSLLITEDADRFVAKREDENLSMVGLLNASAGIAGGRVKFIISTNLANLNAVDEALVRPGRCHKVIPFRALEPEEAMNAREAMGLDNTDISFSANVTLAEALNVDNGSKKLMKGMGFNLK